jgi:hypothetical protein
MIFKQKVSKIRLNSYIHAMCHTIVFLIFMMNLANAQIKGIPLRTNRFLNFANPLRFHHLSLDADRKNIIHRICPYINNKADLEDFDQRALELECDAEAWIPTEDVILYLKQSWPELVSFEGSEVEEDKLDLVDLITEYQKSESTLTREFWTLLETHYEEKSYLQSNFYLIYTVYQKGFVESFIQFSWDYSRASLQNNQDTLMIRKIKNENTNRLVPLFSKTPADSIEDAHLWTLILIDSHTNTKDQKLIYKKELRTPGLTCSFVFGPNWKEPSYRSLVRNYDALLQTEIYKFLEDQRVWTSDTKKKGDEILKGSYLLRRKGIFANHRRRLKYLKEGSQAYKLCQCNAKLQCYF